MKPTRWFGDDFGQTVWSRRSPRDADPYRLTRYYRCLCAHYVGEARKWMRESRMEHRLLIAEMRDHQDDRNTMSRWRCAGR